MAAQRQAARGRWENTEGPPEPMSSRGPQAWPPVPVLSPPGIRLLWCWFPKLLAFGTASLSPPPADSFQELRPRRHWPLSRCRQSACKAFRASHCLSDTELRTQSSCNGAVTAIGRQEAQGGAAHRQVRPGEKMRVTGPWVAPGWGGEGQDRESVHSSSKQLSKAHLWESLWAWPCARYCGSTKTRSHGPCLPGTSILWAPAGH